ncbi:anti-sigma factor [Aquibium carbonis]|uniref:Anti-sigma factor n=1 Tax=Aquibium carbonis TaxID=2495581 RepID=A0A3R9ZSA9_9HYPH|nr:anti-sigma factor [Aquibium carbonis]RST86528.1 anti-sigma factor [Aquibium carbonis]
MTRAGEFGEDGGGDDILAAEYVVGALSAEERRAVAARIDGDAEFARLVERWEANLAPMQDGFEPVEPPASVKRRLDERLFDVTAASAGAPAARGGLWHSLAFWRGLAVAAVLAVVVLAAQPYLFEQSEPQTNRLVASLAPRESDVHYFVVYDARTADIGLSHVTGERETGRDFELWVVEGDRPPVSLGVIPAGSTVHLAVDQALRVKIEQGAVFAISLEPQGGSPTGQPTGPVVAAGDLRDI